MKVAVVTPTIGSEHLSLCLQSVQEQTYDNLTHYVFIDGKENGDSVHQKIFDHCGKRKCRTISLEENVGKGWYGHRVYAACSFLVNADIICYLDEDNWYDPDHVESLVKEIEKGNDWAYSLRKIYDKERKYLCNDDCESLGKWPVYFNKDVYHIDTSSFAVKKDIVIHVGQAWYGQWGADRQFFNALKKYFPKFSCNKKYSLNYRLDGNDSSVKEDFFTEGNKVMNDRYNGDFPWIHEKEIVEKEIGPGIVLIE